MLGAMTFGGPTVGIFLLVIVALVMIGVYFGAPTRWGKAHHGKGAGKDLDERHPRPR